MGAQHHWCAVTGLDLGLISVLKKKLTSWPPFVHLGSREKAGLYCVVKNEKDHPPYPVLTALTPVCLCLAGVPGQEHVMLKLHVWTLQYSP